MKISFLYPQDPFNPKKVDEAFKKEFLNIKDEGFNVHLVNVDDLDNHKKLNLEDDEKLIYRGWMLTKDRYSELEKLTKNKLLTNTEQYIKAHHLPNWYEGLKAFTMKSQFCEGTDVTNLYNKWGHDKPAFVKDYVKSIKTGASPIVSNVIELQELIERMKKYRGFIEGGIVLREPMVLKGNTETRFFVLQDNLFSKSGTDTELETFAHQIKEKMENKLTFYSMDIVRDENNQLFLIEIGDGQVSDSVGWDTKEFTNIFQILKPRKILKP